MAEYIEREAAIAYLENHKKIGLEKNIMLAADEDAIIEFLKKKCPTADVVEARHGAWGFDGLGWTCSECGEYALTNKVKLQVHSGYCPHCGAKMDGERREQ